MLHCAFSSPAAHWSQPVVTAGVANDHRMLQPTVRKTFSLPPRRTAVPVRCTEARGTVQRCSECDLCEQTLASQRLLLALRRLLAPALAPVLSAGGNFFGSSGAASRGQRPCGDSRRCCRMTSPKGIKDMATECVTAQIEEPPYGLNRLPHLGSSLLQVLIPDEVKSRWKEEAWRTAGRSP